MPSSLLDRQIGPFSVSAIGLGCMNLSHGYLPRPDAAAAERLLLHALDSGVTFFDTAALYGFGRNEELLGRTLMHRRREFTLASKCVLAEIDGKRGIDGSPQAIVRVLEHSLRRLRVDHIDLYYMHRLDPKVPLEESLGALVRAKEEGKIGAIGLSEMSAATIRRAHSMHPIAAVQTEYSPWTRNPEIAVLDACKELGIGFVAFSPLGRGLLAGNVGSQGVADGDIRADIPRFLPPHLAHNLALYERFQALAAEAGCTAAQLSLAWLLSKGGHIVPIPGTTNIAHLDEDLAALSLDLPDRLFADVDALFPAGAAAGARYSPAAQAQTGTETWPDEVLA
ncbi:putative oxidoreductase, aryl-alcohol dehydrogenase like protein [Sphingobium herbicidovorans NBRC 16415]|uniref:Oxidoreductase, aryl-alcohol dehydrogenase like protein n=1 Tax=Sphingobium herbicidovorans (strain ATCC 700291 / DSM 11019 / CCUG 56400 / KCTC 2939 / LMG 18315 / NBRC 16415 / MH) TaxID=1219045 RepID=A0A086P4D6_SPHHM|nr:aldo/keto reductase [Sphingobium herbicidovorans]KFG88254.1 putative oxidoreductase, aryl-alcohol dehydrogenase like protein [Sphingobium herbicidovorans NBRC 16415]